MTRADIIEMFRTENSEITERVITDPLLHDWCKLGDQEICARTRCIVDDDGTTITTAEDDQSWDLTAEIDKFFDIDEIGGGVTYNDKRLKETTIPKLDADSPNWRNRSSGTPKAYYRRGKWVYMDRPINSDAEDVKVYSVLISDPFDDDDKTPYNELPYLFPYHYGINKYLQWKAKAKVGKPSDADKAMLEFASYAKWMKTMLGGHRYGPIYYQPRR